MADVAIRAEGLSKQYRIGEKQSARTLRETISDAVRAPFGRGSRTPRETIWALKDVSFEIAPGEVVGVIGRNGAGKSTLLKILSRITDPTEGRAEVHGRVGSLLEVGTGFHGELTGRENIFLNGAILGMKRAEIASKFDEIVAFAEVEKFIDTPVKHYSSGMYLRLAFAVAAHLEPEILLVDEVLAVGDALFQKKCLGKMEELSAVGRTVVFVSHSMQAVTRLCRRGLLLSAGRVAAEGPINGVTAAYLRTGADSPVERRWDDLASAPGNNVARLVGVRVVDDAGAIVHSVDIRDRLGIEVSYVNLSPGARLLPVLHLYNDLGVNLFTSLNAADSRWYNRPHPAGRFCATCWIPGNLLAEGQVSVRASVCTHNPNVTHASEFDAVSFVVVDESRGDAARGEYAGDFPGVVRPLLQWTMEVAETEASPAPATKG